MLRKPLILLCVVALSITTLASATAQAKNPHKSPYPKGWKWEQEKTKHYANGSEKPPWMPQIWFAIAACEQPYNGGTQWDAYSQGYEGAFGFAHDSWDAFKLPGYPESASQASAWQQYVVARAIHARYGFSGWGCYTGGGYRYHM